MVATQTQKSPGARNDTALNQITPKRAGGVQLDRGLLRNLQGGREGGSCAWGEESNSLQLSAHIKNNTESMMFQFFCYIVANPTPESNQVCACVYRRHVIDGTHVQDK